MLTLARSTDSPGRRGDPARPAAESRQRVERCLAAAWAQVGNDPPPAVVTAALGAALCELGPAFRAFGRYLAERPDLLPEPSCRVLAALPENGAALPPLTVRARIEAACGQPLERAFQRFEEVPCRVRLGYQEHRAVAGEPVVVRLVHDDLAATVETEREGLPLILAALAPELDSARCVAAVGEFRAALAAAGDCAAQATALRTLAGGGAGSPRPLVAAVVENLSGPSVVTRRALSGTSLGEWTAAGRRPSSEAPESSEAGDLAERFCRTWLAQALFGTLYPTALTGDDVRVLAEGRVAWVGGVYSELPAPSRARLWSYLQAAAVQDPDAAAAALISELTGGPADGGRALVQLLRQVIPFRDAGLGARDDLAGYLFLHWRLSARLGYRPRPHLAAFWRGLSIVAMRARELAPGRDSLRAAIDRLRLSARLGEMVERFSPGEMQSLAADALVTLLDLPGKLDRALSLAAEGKLTLTLQQPPVPDADTAREGSNAVTAALLTIVAVGVGARTLLGAGVGGAWLEPGATGVVLVLGLLLVRDLFSACRRGGRRRRR